MNLDDLGDKLAALNPGDVAEVPYDVYASLFPPGEPDDNARMRAYNFAKAHDCTFDNWPSDRIVRRTDRTPLESARRRLRAGICGRSQGCSPRSGVRSSAESWPKLRIHVMQLSREGSPPPGLSRSQAK